MTGTTTTAAPLVEAIGLSVRYGAKRAVDDVSFVIPKGRVVGLLGHNGCCARPATSPTWRSCRAGRGCKT